MEAMNVHKMIVITPGRNSLLVENKNAYYGSSDKIR